MHFINKLYAKEHDLFNTVCWWFKTLPFIFTCSHIYTILYLQHRNFIFILSELFDNYTEISYLCD
jgi:hypothetical protein